jgi:hypothetical protein
MQPMFAVHLILEISIGSRYKFKKQLGSLFLFILWRTFSFWAVWELEM